MPRKQTGRCEVLDNRRSVSVVALDFVSGPMSFLRGLTLIFVLTYACLSEKEGNLGISDGMRSILKYGK